jgi:tellurite resistance protein TerA
MGMAELAQGQRIKLTDLGLASQFTLAFNGGTNVDVACFGLDADRRLVDERYMTFFNQPRTPCGGVVAQGPSTFELDLSKLPPAIGVLVVTLSVDGAGTMRSLPASAVELRQGGMTLARFAVHGGMFASERALMLVEIYRKDGLWRFNALGQGFDGGLDAVVRHFGGTVADATPPPPPPPPAPSKVVLTKAGEVHKVNLSKAADAPSRIVVKATWVDNGDGSDDNDDLDLRVGLLMPDGRMTLIQAPARMGAFDAMPFVRHQGDVRTASVNAPATEVVEINPRIGQAYQGPVTLVFSVYSAVSNGVVSVASLQPKMRMEYGQQVVECAYDFKQSRIKDESEVYTYVIGLVEIDGDSISLSPSGITSPPGSENTPWLTRDRKGGVQVGMDGPAVFKGKDGAKMAAAYNAGNKRKYV